MGNNVDKVIEAKDGAVREINITYAYLDL